MIELPFPPASLSGRLVRTLVNYNPETGLFFWRERDVAMFGGTSDPDALCRSWNARHAGRAAFASDNGQGYLVGAIFGRKYKAHRVAWLIVHGDWPIGHIDHINGDTKDNRIDNLRDVSPQTNAKNQKLRRNNSSGVNGVTWDKYSSKWAARITVNGKLRRLGRFSTKADAIAARVAADGEYGFHENHGRHYD